MQFCVSRTVDLVEIVLLLIKKKLPRPQTLIFWLDKFYLDHFSQNKDNKMKQRRTIN